jgi:NADPH:quinone reductase-like Zn-dependent oxidoreductase
MNPLDPNSQPASPNGASPQRQRIAVVGSGKVRIRIDQRYPLAEAAQAHRDLEARKTTGSGVLLP